MTQQKRKKAGGKVQAEEAIRNYLLQSKKKMKASTSFPKSSASAPTPKTSLEPNPKQLAITPTSNPLPTPFNLPPTKRGHHRTFSSSFHFKPTFQAPVQTTDSHVLTCSQPLRLYALLCLASYLTTPALLLFIYRKIFS